MLFTEEQRNEIADIAGTAWDRARLKRITESKDQPKEETETKVYLISMAHTQIAFPDADGRSILSQSFYARVTSPKGKPQFYGGAVEVIAWGDGRPLASPMTTILTGTAMVALVEVPDAIALKAAG